MSYDIIIGISTKNVETTIGDVTSIIDHALNKYFSRYNSLIICSDGYSTDNTKKIFNRIKTNADKKFMLEKKPHGKGSAIKTIFETAVKEDAKAVALIDGDLESIELIWLKNLLGPILDKKYELVVPHYARDKDDGVLTNHLVYPLTKALYGANIRQPIGGEYGLSLNLIKNLLASKDFPRKFGIDVFITTTAFCENFKIIQARLGIKEHYSTKSYNKPDSVLAPMFDQVMTRVFKLTHVYKKNIVNFKEIKNVPYVGKKVPTEVKDIYVDILSIIREYREKYKKYNERFKIFPADLRKELDHIISEKGFVFPICTWVRAVYFIMRAHDKNIKHSLDVLRILWKAWFASYVIQTTHMTDAEAEKVIEGYVKVFIEKRKLFFKK